MGRNPEIVTQIMVRKFHGIFSKLFINHQSDFQCTNCGLYSRSMTICYEVGFTLSSFKAKSISTGYDHFKFYKNHILDSGAECQKSNTPDLTRYIVENHTSFVACTTVKILLALSVVFGLDMKQVMYMFTHLESLKKRKHSQTGKVTLWNTSMPEVLFLAFPDRYVKIGIHPIICRYMFFISDEVNF